MKILKGHYYIKFDFLYMNIYNIIKSNVLEMVQFVSVLYAKYIIILVSWIAYYLNNNISKLEKINEYNYLRLTIWNYKKICR